MTGRGLDLAGFEARTRRAVRCFWRSRERARKRNVESGRRDRGGRAAVTSGGHMDGFADLVQAVVVANGLPPGSVVRGKGERLAVPGHFRPTKRWDVLVIDKGDLIGVVEFKSQVGSFGNNFNNRCEEAVGVATDFRTASRERSFGAGRRIFRGFLMLVEDCPESRTEVSVGSPHFEVDRVFKGASYIERYAVLCERMMEEGLYDSASLLVSSSGSGRTRGTFSDAGGAVSMRLFVSALAGAVAVRSAGTRAP